ncbi:MAG: hypothetical protein LUF34_02850 [Lachnospiraceae bacterium]|nr:hypothetical protein [Lachnospiraceae bacterium]
MLIDVSVENMNHVPEVLAVPEVDGVFLPGDRLEPEEWREAAARVQRAGKKAYLALPHIFRGETGEYFAAHGRELVEAHFDGFLVRSLDEVGFLSEQGLPGLRIFDAGMYTWNREAAAVMWSLGADILTLPYEARERELAERGYEDSELVVYGRLPAMISAQCTGKTQGTCRAARGKKEDIFRMPSFRRLRDRKGAFFVEDSRCRFCYSVLYNSVPLWLLARVPAACGRIRFSFTDEEAGEAGRILWAYVRGERTPSGSFTRGHFTRGVE